MAASAGQLIVDISTNTARLAADMGKVSSIMNKTFGGMASMIKTAIPAGTFLALGREALQMGDSISKASEKLGIGAEKLSAMMYAATLSDVSLEGLEKGMKKFSQAIIEANAAGSDAATAFSVLGIATKDAHGKTLPLDELFKKVADRFSTMEDGAGKVSIAVALFGRSGMDMIPILNKGAAGIAELEGEARRLGATISDKTAKQLETANDNLKSFWMSVKGVTASITGGLVGAFKRMGEAYGESLGAGEGFDMPGPDAKRFKGPPLPAKIAAPNIDAMKKASEERKKLLEDYAKLHAANLAKEGEEVHNALAAEMGMSQEYHDTVSKMGMDEFAEWKKQQEEELALLEKFEHEKIQMLKDTQDAQRAEMENDTPAAPYLFEDALKAAEAYGNVSLALQTMNSELGAQYAIVQEGQSYIALYQQAWMDANLAIADSMASLYSGMQNWISSSLEGLITGTMKVADVMKNLGKMMLSIITEYVAKWLVSKLFMAVMSKTFQAQEVAAAFVTGALVAEAWAPAAAMASLATLGENSIEAIAGMTATVAAAKALAVPALAEGGIVNRPTLALIGESGPEAVVPLGKGKGGIQDLTVNLYMDGEAICNVVKQGIRTGRLNLVLA